MAAEARETVHLPAATAAALEETSLAMGGVPADVVAAAALEQFSRLPFADRRLLTLDLLYNGRADGAPAPRRPGPLGRLLRGALGLAAGVPGKVGAWLRR